ncbi:hypothetical protein PIB30_096995 [Stylosanthes scabra]|uniref:Uncharacterized protein n=1 Tax=Stylosanthes scabra TaxID=79078 RepID=A0ABU6RWG5_9FABA|nr:hypothetical protein [Stylosanthes scabra]
MACCFFASSSALFTAFEAIAASRLLDGLVPLVDFLFRSRLRVTVVGCTLIVDWYFFVHLLLGSPALRFLFLEYEIPTDGANVKVGSLNDCPKDFEWGAKPQYSR